MQPQIQERILQGSSAKLFPVLPESKKEERATSILLSVLTIVPDFASKILEGCGVSISKRTIIESFTEISLKGEYSKMRPDGLLIVQNKTKTWSALIESKIGNATHSDEQIENYLNLAKEQKIDAVITISNQYTASPSIHPSYVKKQKHKSIALLHFSWASINADSILLIENKSVDDKEQAYILHELTRYLSHSSSGISSDILLPKSWKSVCDSVYQGVALKKNSPEAEETVAAWFQLLRFSTINLSLALSRSCTVQLSRAHLKENNIRTQESVSSLISKSLLAGAIQVPDAASNLEIELDLNKRTLKLCAKIQTPKDVKQTRAAINFVINQFKKSEDETLFIRFNWPSRINATQGKLLSHIDEETRLLLVPEGYKGLPTSAEIVRIVDLGASVKSSKKLNEIFDSELINFYRNTLQNITNWQPKAPRVKKSVNAVQTSDADQPTKPTNSGEEVRSWPFMLGIFDNK